MPMFNKKICVMLAALCCLCSSLSAKVGDKMYVNVQEAVLKTSTGFFAAEAGVLPYGTQIKVLAEKGKWVQVECAEEPSLRGWLTASSLTKKKILLNNGVLSVVASAEELALAGKGFSAEMESLYENQATQAAYDFLDSMESRKIDKDSLLEFIVEGELSGGEE